MAKTKTTALALLLALAAPVLAQETDDAATAETATEDSAAATSAADELSMGIPVGTAEVGKPYIAATFEAWEQRCLKTELEADPCELYYLLKDEQGAAVAEFSLYGLPEGVEGPAIAGATFMAPLETLLTAGVALQIDDQEAKAYPFTVCSGAGCMARLGFTAEEIEAMKQGAEITITVVPFLAPDQKVDVKMSLKGFTAGMEAINAANAAADAAASAKAAAEGATEGEAATTP